MCNNRGASPIPACLSAYLVSPRPPFVSVVAAEPLVRGVAECLFVCLHRLLYANYTISRPHGEQGRYMSIPHHHRGEVQFLGRWAFVRTLQQAHNTRLHTHIRPLVKGRGSSLE